jgi:hypothetical protein
MIAGISFDFPPGWQIGLPVVITAVTLAAWWQKRQGVERKPLIVLASLRTVALLALIFLAARPVWIVKEPPQTSRRSVVLLLDKSESMSLAEGDRTRYQQALTFARDHLLSALKSSDLPVQAMLFAQEAESADGSKLADAMPNGKRTNLGGAIARAMASGAAPPLAVIALTDGIANETADNTRALSALVDARVPFVGVGFGSDAGVRTLSLRQVDAPPVVAPNTEFHICAQLEMMNSEEMPAFDLVLFRDGQAIQNKTVQAGSGSRFWLESFRVAEKEVGAHNYSVQFLPPTAPGLKCVSTMGSASVRIAEEKELRVLYVQGALTWDYKFVTLALKNDPSIKLTGLTRTSRQSIFRQNVETSGELLGGFPTTLEEIAPFRVVVLSNLKPIDLSPPQQELLARFCSELGGGVLMMGGPTTFDFSWQGSRLEQLLPVVFASSQGVLGLDQPFRVELTEEALQHPVFQIADHRSMREVWAEVPAFTQYGRVDSPKPAAQIWALHQQDEGPKGRRILMASQRYGAGLSAIICIQNFWRWRLAKDSDPQQFDRFWRQLFRFLSESSRQDILIHLADQDLHPQTDIRLSLEKQPNPKNVTQSNQKFSVRVENEQKKQVLEQTLELLPARAVETSFRAETPGLYTVTVQDMVKQPVATRSIQIRDVNLEFQNTGRDMETLRQWASLSDGLALKVEECDDASAIVEQIKNKVEQIRRGKRVRRPFGVNGWMLTLVLGCLGAEWILRKQWRLV